MQDLDYLACLTRRCEDHDEWLCALAWAFGCERPMQALRDGLPSSSKAELERWHATMLWVPELAHALVTGQTKYLNFKFFIANFKIFKESFTLLGRRAGNWVPDVVLSSRAMS